MKRGWRRKAGSNEREAFRDTARALTAIRFGAWATEGLTNEITFEIASLPAPPAQP